jgi:hypothetical protein
MAQIVVVDDARNNIPIKGRLDGGRTRLRPDCELYKTAKPYNTGKTLLIC